MCQVSGGLQNAPLVPAKGEIVYNQNTNRLSCGNAGATRSSGCCQACGRDMEGWKMSGDRIDLLKRINALEEENKVLQKALDKACVKLEYSSSLKEEPWDKLSKENWKSILMEEKKDV